MKKIAIVTLAVALENEKGYSRFRSLADILSESYEVDIITSTFQHWEKRQRDIEYLINQNQNKKYRIKFVYEPGYKKNVDVRRIFSHKIAAKNILEVVSREKYDLIYCIIPDNSVAASVGKYAKRNNIKFIVDIEDLWPEAMEMVSPFPLMVNKILFASWRRAAREAYKCADAFVGTSDEYRDFPSRTYNVIGKPAITVYVGCDMDEFDEGVAIYKDKIQKEMGEFWVTYAGNLGASYDISTFIKSMQLIYKNGYQNIVAKILGGGPLESEFKQIAKQNTCNVEFLGYTPYKKMAAYLYKSDILLNSFVKKAPQSIVTKIGDYLAAGKPIINTLSSEEFKNKVIRDGFGVNVEAGNAELLADKIIELYSDKESIARFSQGAYKIGREEFNRKISYQKILGLINKILME